MSAAVPPSLASLRAMAEAARDVNDWGAHRSLHHALTPAVVLRLIADAEAIDVLSRPGWQIDWTDYGDTAQVGLWKIHGSVNDREWTLVGEGPELRDAIRAARTPTTVQSDA